MKRWRGETGYLVLGGSCGEGGLFDRCLTGGIILKRGGPDVVWPKDFFGLGSLVWFWI